MARDKRIDEYIDKAQPFARPVMKKLRTLVHKACPGVTETIKWGMPSFEYKGPMFGFAAFKQHCVAGFWKSKLLKDPDGFLGERSVDGGDAMGNLGRMTSVKDLPPDDVIMDFIRQAVMLNEMGIKIKKKPATGKKELVVPDYFTKALKRNKSARETFENFSYTNKKDYVEWVTEAKSEETRKKRLETSIEWMSQGKTRHWKYARPKAASVS